MFQTMDLLKLAVNENMCSSASVARQLPLMKTYCLFGASLHPFMSECLLSFMSASRNVDVHPTRTRPNCRCDQQGEQQQGMLNAKHEHDPGLAGTMIEGTRPVYRLEHLREPNLELVGGHPHDDGVGNHCQEGNHCQHCLPRSNTGGHSGRRSLCHETQLEEIRTHFDHVASDGQDGCQGKGRSKQNYVAELNHHLEIIVKGLILTECQSVLHCSLARICVVIFLANCGSLFGCLPGGPQAHHPGDHALHNDTASRIGSVNSHQFGSKFHHIELIES